MDRIGQWLWYANFAALAGLLARIAVTGLYRVYPFLFVYFLVDTAGSLVLTQFPLRSNSYAITYMALRVVVHILAILVVLEMYRVALAKHPGLAGFGRASFLIVTLCATVIATAATWLDRDVLSGQSAVLHRFFTLERTIELVIVVFLLLISAFVTYFPVELSRNTAFSIGGFSIFYFTRAAGLLAVNLLRPIYFAAISNGLLGISLVFLVGWALVLRPERVGADSVAGHSWDPAALARLHRQLDAINSALVRFGRR